MWRSCAFPSPSSACTLAQPRCHRSRGRTNTDRLPDQQRMAQAPESGRGGLRPRGPVRAPAAAHGRLGLCHRDEVTNSIAISYSCICNRFPSSYPSFAIRCPRALKTVCGRLEIVDRRDDHALIRRCGAPSPPPPLSPNDDRASASDAYAWPADRGTIEPNRRAGRSCTSSDVRACSAAGAEPHATLDDAGTAETLLIQWQCWRRRESNPCERVSVTN